jgi:uncharacterized protein
MRSRASLEQRVVIVALAALLASCGTSPSVRYYTLSEPAATTVDKSGHALVALGPLSLADYLQRPQIVVRRQDQQLQVAEYDRWAETPDRAIARWLARDLDAQLAAATVVDATTPASAPDYRVRGAIAQWDVDASANAVLVAQWEIIDRNGKPVVAMRSSRYATAIASVKDYAEVVRGLNATLAALADEIAAALSRVLASDPQTR